MRALLLVAVCVVFGAGVACGTSRSAAKSDWRIGLDWRIGPVHIDETKDRVEAALGPGVRQNPDRLDGPYFYYPQAKLYVGYYRDRGKDYAIVLVTQSPRYETASGARVGLTLKQLRERLKVVCEGDGAVVRGVQTDPATYTGECNHEPSNRDHPFTGFMLDTETEHVRQIQIDPGGD